jgi:peptidoglycan/xylan/chitin deacetylase (PgdA/CDA1 family)
MKDGKMKILKYLSVALIAIAFIGGALFYFLPLKGDIPVLMYHFVVPKQQVGPTSLDVSVENFEAQMRFLKKFGFRPIAVDEFYLIKTRKIKPQGKEVLVTFDDGNETYLKYALPILERYQIPSVNFLVWDALVKKEHGSMGLEDAVRFSKHALVTFGSHTLTHPNLLELNSNQARSEIFESKQNLEQALRKPVEYFTYPSGFLNEETLALVEEAGYRLAYTTSKKRLQSRPESLFSITRVKVHPRHNLLIFWANLAGFSDFGKSIERFFHQLTGYKQSDKLNVYEPAQKAL